MNNYTIVRPEHLNHHGNLFGGIMLKWVDEFAWITASLDFPGYKLVTRSMQNIDFTTGVANGSILRFEVLPKHQGSTSILYQVTVYADPEGAATEDKVFSTEITFVSVDSQGNKTPLPHLRPLRSEQNP